MSSNPLLARPSPIERRKNTVTIVSMARRITQTPPCDLYIDVASFMDDDFPPSLTGKDVFVKSSLYSMHYTFFTNLGELVLNMNIESGLIVVIACEAGLRRSVATAELLAQELLANGIKSEVHHKGLDRWFKF